MMCLIDCLKLSAEGWREKPDSQIEVFRGGNVTLTYGYSGPRVTESLGTFYFSRHTPGTSYERMLKEGKVDPHTGHIHVDTTYQSVGNVFVTSYPEGFSIILTGLDITDSAHYLTDVKFEREATLQDTVVVNVYNIPTFVEKPPVEIIHEENDTASMTWALNDLPSQPEIRSVTLSLVQGDTNYILVRQSLIPQTGQWTVTYSDAQQRFKGRISYAPGPALEYITLTVWNLNPGDNGKYILNIGYANDVTGLNGVTQLHVTSGNKWISSPADLTYAILSRELVLNFTADISNNILHDLKYELRHEHQEPIASLVVRETDTELKTIVTWRLSRTVIFNRTTSSVSIRIPDPEFKDGGDYTMQLRDRSGLVLMQHRFSLVVINESALIPSIDQTSSPGNFTDMMWFEIKITGNIPKPDIIVYIKVPEKNTELNRSGLIYARATDTDAMTTSVPRGYGFIVVVMFDYPGLVYTRSWTRDIDSDQEKESEAQSDPPILVTTNDDYICSDKTNTRLLISVQVCVLLLILVISTSTYRLFYWKRHTYYFEENPQLVNYKPPCPHPDPSSTFVSNDVTSRDSDPGCDCPISATTIPSEEIRCDSDYSSGGSSPTNSVTIESPEDDECRLETTSDVILSAPLPVRHLPDTRLNVYLESHSLLKDDDMEKGAVHDRETCQAYFLSSSPKLPPF